MMMSDKVPSSPQTSGVASIEYKTHRSTTARTKTLRGSPSYSGDGDSNDALDDQPAPRAKSSWQELSETLIVEKHSKLVFEALQSLRTNLDRNAKLFFAFGILYGGIANTLQAMKLHLTHNGVQSEGFHLLSDAIDSNSYFADVLVQGGIVTIMQDAIQHHINDSCVVNNALALFGSLTQAASSSLDDQEQLLFLSQKFATILERVLRSFGEDEDISGYAGTILWHLSGRDQARQELVDAGVAEAVAYAIRHGPKEDSNAFLTLFLRIIQQHTESHPCCQPVVVGATCPFR